MTRRRLFWLLYLAAMLLCIGLPIYAMNACSGWNEGSMQVARCSPNWASLHELAEGGYAFMLLASFTGGIPILILLVGIWLICFIVSWIMAWILGLPARKTKT